MDPVGLSSLSGEQLDAIARLEQLFRDRHIDSWLFGGWGVDFWVGRVTRQHGDVDLAVPLGDRHAIHDLLLGDGWDPAPVDDAVIGAGYRRNNVLVELTFIETGDDGQVLIPFVSGAAVWSTIPFGDMTRELRGVRCRTIPLEVLRADKSKGRDSTDQAAKDTEDHEALSRVEAAGN